MAVPHWWFYGAQRSVSGLAALAAAAALSSGAGTFTVPTYTGQAAVSSGAATASGAGTHTVPTYTGESATTVGGATHAGSGTHVPPVYSGESADSTGAATTQGTGTFAVPVYSGESAAISGACLAIGAGTHEAPVYSGESTVATGAALIGATGTHGVPVYLGTSAVSSGAGLASGAGTHTSPVYSGAASNSQGAVTVSAAGLHEAPGYLGGGALVAGGTIAEGVGDWSIQLVTGIAALAHSPTSCSGAGTCFYLYPGISTLVTPAATVFTEGLYGPYVVLASPRFKALDSRDGTGAVVTIVNATAGTTNTLYGWRFGADCGSIVQQSLGSRSGNGTMTVDGTAGRYLGYLKSTKAGTSGIAVSDIVPFTISDSLGEIDDELYYRCCVWAREAIVALGLTSLTDANTVILKLPWRAIKQVGSAGVIVTPTGENVRYRDNARYEVGYKIQVTTFRATNHKLDETGRLDIAWRRTIQQWFSEQSPVTPAGVKRTQVQPGPIILPAAFAAQYDVGAFVLTCWANRLCA